MPLNYLRLIGSVVASVAVVTVDRSGVIQFLTTPASVLLGASQPTVIGRPFSDFVELFDLETFTAAQGHPQTSADHFWTCRRPDGLTFPLGLQLGLTSHETDSDYATLCLTDLTQSHAAEARARDLHNQLNQVWRLNSLGEIAASLAHELNQPLSAAATYLHASQVDIQRAGPIAQSADRTLELAKAQILRAGQIIWRMRDLLRFETLGLGVERVAPMLADLAGVFDMMARAAGVAIEVQVDDLEDHVQAERIQFQQAILNLVRNALEALVDVSEPRLLIIGRTVSDEHYELRVEDNGPGIPAGEIETIFRPMFTTKTGGMGLGLSVTRTIVESHGGLLKVETSDMGGAAFSFRLTRAKELEEG